MDLAILLIISGFILSSILLVLLVVMASRRNVPVMNKRSNVKSDLRKIKEKVEEE